MCGVWRELITVLSQDMRENVNGKLSDSKKTPVVSVIPNFALNEFFHTEECPQISIQSNIYQSLHSYDENIELIEVFFTII